MDQGRRFRNRSPFRARSMRQGGQPWTPILLNPYAWYDAHAGGSSTQITDSSTNARAAATFGATTASPLYLPYTGTPYLHLEAAGTGTNSLTCTAPANTASYSATPLGGGAASTGAAAAGAFTFTTAGDWLTVELRDAGANVLARYRASDSTQTGHTDAFAVAWTVNRGTAGRKSVVLGWAANSDRSVVLFGTDDYAELPAAVHPGGAAWTAVVAARLWSTTTAHVLIGAKPSAALNQGWWLRRSSGNLGQFLSSDGVTQPAPTVASSAAGVSFCLFGAYAATVQTIVNSSASSSIAAAAGSVLNANPYRIGMMTGGAEPSDMEFSGFLLFDRVLTAAERAQIVTYYRGGV